MGCGPGVAGKSRSAGVFVVSITFSTRTPGSITRESMAPRIRAAIAAAMTQQLVEHSQHFFGDVIIYSRSDFWNLQPPNGPDQATARGGP